MEQFSLARAISLMASEQWSHVGSTEKDVHQKLVERHGPTSRQGIYIPGHALRDLTAAGSGAGLVATGIPASLGYLQALKARSVALSLGATVVPVGKGNVVVPKGTGAAVANWLSDENAPITESQPTLQQASATPKVLAVLVDVSRQLLTQSNAEAVVRAEISSAAAAELDRVVIQGSGAAGQPLGIVNTSGIGTFTGAALNQAALRNAQADVANANAVLNSATCGYATTPAVAELLATRQRFTGSDRTLLEGLLADGIVEGARCIASTNVPAATAIFGDFSSIAVLQWDGGAQIAVDPFTKFNSGIVSVRLLLLADVVLTRPTSFSVATSVT